MHKQWLDMEKMKMQQEQDERERERNHEMRLMEMFSMMINRNPAQPPRVEDHPHTSLNQPSPVYTELQNGHRVSNCYSPFNFPS